ncbi:hypothetical protein DUNSADRAFT_5292 [Dunaliella salina]|uniref:F-box domain-containing protein n=1 Tax=Dunaliella salina TaxID=3046 RepID=A0ABQ7GQL5_DUNSA|nr:hypothetical protein DUNSADRAFT_5292 [Dunaliella salina]|eukprot:KAF5836900.1 hypothetical protein DUNSADRAFT_5292 [Dunaliella salina]
MLELLDFPDDLLLKVFAGCGARGCARAATCCKRLRSLAGSCGENKSIYSSATSCESTLQEALADATKRALEGLTGTSVDFALVFISSYPARECRHVVPTLRRLLPKGTGVIGCTTDGLMGLDAKGHGMEKDPSEKKKAKEAVAILLGRVLGSHVCLIPDYRAAVQGALAQEDVAATFSQGLSYCLGLGEVHTPGAEGAEAQKRRRRTQASEPAKSAAQAASSSIRDSSSRSLPAPPSCVWLLGKDDECHSVMSWIEEMKGHQGHIPVAGGLTSALFFSFGADQAARFPHLTDRHLEHASFVALVLCPKETENSGNSSLYDTAAESQTACTDAMLQAAQADAGSSNPAAGYTQAKPAEKQASGPHALSAAPSPTVGVEGAPRLPPTRAAALTFFGVGAEVGAKVYRASELKSGGSSGPFGGKLFSLSMKLVSIPGASAAVDFTRELDSMYERGNPLEGLALWPEGAGDTCSLELLQKGQALILIAADAMDAEVKSSDGSEVVAEGAFYVGNDIEKEQLLHLRQCQTFCVQLVSINTNACQAQLPRDLQVLQRACDRATEQDCTHYWHAQQSAAVAGACSSPMALVAFSCNGRGRQIFGQDPASSEAHLVARAVRSSVAFVGGRMFGEIGPEVFSSNGLAGWGFSPGYNLDTSSQTRPAPAHGPSSQSGNPFSGSHEAVAQPGRNVLVVPGTDAMPGRELALAAPGAQGFTTVYAAVC